MHDRRDTSRVRVAVVDDEPMALSGLAALLAQDADVEIVATCADGRDAIDQIVRLAPDIVFLDVQMPEIDGFAVLEQVSSERLPVVVFVTAFDEFAVRAFDVSAVDYVLKPFADERVLEALSRAKRAVHARDYERISGTLDALLRSRVDPHAHRDGRFTIREVSRVYWVPMRSVDWIEGADYYVRLHARGKTHLLRESLNALTARLDTRQFCRIHRSAIVNLTRVAEIRSSPSGALSVVLHDGTRLKLSRARRDDLERALERLGD